MTDMLRELEQSYEAKFKLDEELRFKMRCRRNRLFGVWAAGRMALPTDEAEAYARKLVQLDLEMPGHIDVLHKVLADCAARKVVVGKREADRMLAEFEALAYAQVTEAYPMPLGSDHMQIGG